MRIARRALVCALAAPPAPAAIAHDPDGPQGDSHPAGSPKTQHHFGRGFDGPMEGHEPGMPVHYDLHAWVWKRNPGGTFAM